MTEYYGLRTVLDPEHITITQSDLAAFKRDRRIWFLKTYLGIRARTVKTSSPLVLGTLVHAALEDRYVNGTDILVAFHNACLQAEIEYRSEDPYFDEAGWLKQAEMGRVMLEGYEEWLDTEHIDSNITTLDIEKLVRFATVYDGVPVTLTGKVDHVVQDKLTGEILIYDWKTCADLERMTRQAHTTEQLPFYMTLQQAMDPANRVGGAAFTMLKKSKRTDRAKPPFYRRETVRYSPQALESRQDGIDGAIRDYVRVITQLHEGTNKPMRYAYPNPGVLQFDRELDPIIDVMDNGGHVGAIVTAQFSQVNPYIRYGATPTSMLEDN